MPESHILLERYRLERLLGKGGMGRVYLAEDIYDHSFWAVKIEDLHEKNLEFVRSEINILALIILHSLRYGSILNRTADYILSWSLWKGRLLRTF